MFRIRNINETAKDNAPINSLPYPLPLALANGSNEGTKVNRPTKNDDLGENLLSDGREFAFKNE